MRPLCSALAVVLLTPACREPADDGEQVDALPSTGSESGTSGGESGSDESTSGEPTGSSDDTRGGSTGAVEGPIEDRACEPDHGLSAANFGMPFLLTWCAGCHSADLPADERAGAPVGVDLDTLDAAQEQLLRIYARTVLDGATMPPAGGPSEQERAMLGDWLACGAPE